MKQGEQGRMEGCQRCDGNRTDLRVERYSGGRQSRMDLSEIHQWSISNSSSRISLTMCIPSPTSLRKMLEGDGEIQSKPLSTNSRSWSPPHPSSSSPTTPSPTVLKQIPPTWPPEQSCCNSHWRTAGNGIWLLSSPRVSAQLSRTMRSMTRRCWPLSEHWRSVSRS